MSAQSISKPPQAIPWMATVSTGLALFSMFFGAGNLIFPLIVGRMAGSETSYAVLGLGLSAVAFPLLGLAAMMLYGGNIQAFLGRLGRWPAFALLLVLQMSQGPFGAMPRLVTLMHASLKAYIPQLPLSLFSILICGLVFALTLRPRKIVPLLGVVLTPLLLLTLAPLGILGFLDAPVAQWVPEGSVYHFSQGLKLGYQTTDLIAALLFATLILPHLAKDADDSEEGKKMVRKRMTYASLIAAGLLMGVYILLCFLSAHHSGKFPSDLPPEELLHAIAVHILGPIGGIATASAVFLACLTTAISLAAVFAEYIKKDLTMDRMKPAFALITTLAITALMANLGFQGIVKLWGPLLEVLYPSLIVLCLFNIAHRLYEVKPVQAPVFFTLGFAIGGFCFGG
jgi:LIVCS family branched-chain amino acid:cation transporter